MAPAHQAGLHCYIQCGIIEVLGAKCWRQQLKRSSPHGFGIVEPFGHALWPRAMIFHLPPPRRQRVPSSSQSLFSFLQRLHHEIFVSSCFFVNGIIGPLISGWNNAGLLTCYKIKTNGRYIPAGKYAPVFQQWPPPYRFRIEQLKNWKHQYWSTKRFCMMLCMQTWRRARRKAG